VPRGLQLLRCRRERLIDDRHLGRVDCPSAAKADPAKGSRRSPQGIEIPKMQAGIPTEVGMTPGARMEGAGPNPDLELGLAGRGSDTPGPDVTNQAAMSGPQADLQARALQIYEAHKATGRRMSGAALGRQLGTSERHGRRLLAEFRAKEEGSAGRNGHGVAPHKQAGPMRR
jgi:hypothetical protein